MRSRAGASSGLPEPVLDWPIRNETGRLLGITEIVYPEFRVLVEIEGDQHRVSRRQWIRDIEKYAAYVAEGYEVVRLTSVPRPRDSAAGGGDRSCGADPARLAPGT